VVDREPDSLGSVKKVSFVKREVIGLVVGGGTYLFGIIRKDHDGREKKRGTPKRPAEGG